MIRHCGWIQCVTENLGNLVAMTFRYPALITTSILPWECTKSNTIHIMVELYTVTIMYFSIGLQPTMIGLLELLLDQLLNMVITILVTVFVPLDVTLAGDSTLMTTSERLSLKIPP